MNELWYEENLNPYEDDSNEIAKELSRTLNFDEKETAYQINTSVNGIVRIDKPRWGKLDKERNLLSSGSKVNFYLVRLGFQFDLPNGSRDKGFHFVFARCEAFLWSSDSNHPNPRVYDVIPNNCYEGEPRKVTVKVGPEIKINEIGGSIGEVSTDFNIGYITPSIVGWPGEEERTPYWELRPNTKELLGIQHLWILIEFPQNRKGFRLAVRVEAKLQTLIGPIAIGPKERIWRNRPSILIS